MCHTTGHKSLQFCEKIWLHKFILKFTDLYLVVSCFIDGFNCLIKHDNAFLKQQLVWAQPIFFSTKKSLKFRYSERPTKIWKKISIFVLTLKSYFKKWLEIFPNFVAFLQYLNFKCSVEFIKVSREFIRHLYFSFQEN